MNEKKMDKNIKIFSFFVLILSVVFLIGGILLSIILKSTESNNIERELVNKTNLYKTQIDKQFAADIQTLNTVKSFMDFDKEVASETLLNGLNESNKSNKFIRMSLIDQDNTVYHATVNEEIKKEKFQDLNEQLQNSLNQSWKGNNSVSEIFYDEDLKKNVIVVSVPIKKDGEVVGVLAAYDDIEEFRGILEENIIGESYIHLISDNGKFLIRTKNRMYEGDAESIYISGMNVLDVENISNALENGETYYDTFKNNGQKYCIYFTPMKYHNWYLFQIIPYYSVNYTLVLQANYSIFVYSFSVILGGIFILYSFHLLKKHNRLLKRIAYYDELTGLMNLYRFREKSSDVIAEKKPCAIVIMNVKNFQFINDTFGEQNADNLLRFIANTIQKEIRIDEYCCRENADQFVLLLRESDEEKILSRIQVLEKEINKYFQKNKSNYHIQFSTGICICNQEGDYKKMMSHALWAMKKAKQQNESALFFDEKLLSSINLQNDIESSMHQALEQKEFQLYLQPKYNIESNQMIGAEALVRWYKPDGSMIFPDQFIPLFEKNGFCIELDLYMLENVCQMLRNWIDKGIEVYPISVNQTKLLFYRTDYVDRICEIVTKYNIDPQLIILEILEGLAVEDLDTFNACIEKLHKKGFRVSLDDFGSGYSSLSNLNELQVDEIKIDRKFLQLMGNENDIQKNNIFKKIISLVSTLDSEVIVEGVEVEEHIQILKNVQCKYAQGYYFSKPISVKEYEELLIVENKK